MNKKVLFVLLAVLLAALIAGAALLYDELYEDYTGGNGGMMVVDDGEADNSDADTQNKDAASDSEGEDAAKDENKNENENENDNIAPDVEFFDFDENSVMLSDFFDKPVVLNFWATWCGSCKSEMPGFDRLYSKYKDKVNFIMLNVSDDRKTVSDFIDENGYNFPVYYDDTQICSYVYGASSIPLTFVLNKGGEVYGYQIGVLPEEALEGAIKTVLGEE